MARIENAEEVEERRCYTKRDIDLIVVKARVSDKPRPSHGCLNRSQRMRSRNRKASTKIS